ncbi:CAP domain-containing protein [Clostridium formicaceticum]|uniref:Cysteine-rich secretory protein family protein n=1 Tax=Clostridium formicaceticum TaxID=1497 RepID=A0AAC9RGY8_9CLOT|nr:CAP-associated domain-containing protein [Clostridium formicaceticum]AOY76343.1 hypothetical protein BJL90_10765 [Clostridium formicaceticum]ARE86734.1 Cysteine-rich secretory protein family protein [Clostridium formicaceticum]
MKAVKKMIVLLFILWLIFIGIKLKVSQFYSEASKLHWDHSGLVFKLENAEKGISERVESLIHSFNEDRWKKDKTLEAFEEKTFTLLDIKIGDSVETVIEILGQPARQDVSQYGFQWYIYNEDYTKYVQVGIQQGKVVGLYTNSSLWQSNENLQIGTDRKSVETLLGEPLAYIKKGNVIYYLTDQEESHTYLINDYYATIFYDRHHEDKVTAIQLIEKSTEESLQGLYGEVNEELREVFERQVFDLANAARARFGLSLLQWEEKAAMAARKHSKDMAVNNYFAHESPHGSGPSDRIEREGVSWRKSGENIAAGQTSAIFAHENWMNSLGHRENILGDFEKLGVGVYFGGEYHIYYTQEFYTPR